MRIVQRDPSRAFHFWLLKKLPAIRQVPEPVYIETSHLFCKGFIESLLDLGIAPDLILLRRPDREVALSFYAIEQIPERTITGRAYLLSPKDADTLHLPGWERLHDYQLCYWYCLEIRRRMQLYAGYFKKIGCSVADTSLGAITTPEGISRLIHDLRIGVISQRLADHMFAGVVGRKVNTKTDEKRQIRLSECQLQELEAEVLDLVQHENQV
jgi:hypothetical protein